MKHETPAAVSDQSSQIWVLSPILPRQHDGQGRVGVHHEQDVVPYGVYHIGDA